MPALKHLVTLTTLTLTALAGYIYLNFNRFSPPYSASTVVEQYQQSSYANPTSPLSVSPERANEAFAYHILTTGQILNPTHYLPPVGVYASAISLLVFNSPYLLSSLAYFVSALLVFLLVYRYISVTTAWLVSIALLLEPLLGNQSVSASSTLFWLSAHLIILYLLPLHTSSSSLLRSIILGSIIAVTAGGAFASQLLLLVMPLFAIILWHYLAQRQFIKLFSVLVTSILTYIFLHLPYLLQSAKIQLFPFFSFPALNQLTLLLSPVALSSFVFTIFALLTFRKNIAAQVKSSLRIQPQAEKKWYESSTSDQSVDPVSQAAPLLLLSALLFPFLLLLPTNLEIVTLFTPLGLILAAIWYTHTKPSIFLTHPKLATIILILALPIQLLALVVHTTPSFEQHRAQLEHALQHRNHLQLYTMLSNPLSTQRTDLEFAKTLYNLHQSLQLQDQKVAIQPIPQTWPWQTQHQTTLEITYHTPLGQFTHTTPITLTGHYRTWQLQWSWGLLLPNYAPSDTLSYQFTPDQSCGDSVWQPVPHLAVIANTLNNSPQQSEVIADLARLTGQAQNVVITKIQSNAPDDLPILIGPLSPSDSEDAVVQAREMPGVIVLQRHAWTPPLSSAVTTKVSGQLIKTQPNGQSQVIFQNTSKQPVCR